MTNLIDAAMDVLSLFALAIGSIGFLGLLFGLVEWVNDENEK